MESRINIKLGQKLWKMKNIEIMWFNVLLFHNKILKFEPMNLWLKILMLRVHLKNDTHIL